MLSMPPVSTMSASPSRIIWPPLIAAWMPGAAQPIDRQRRDFDRHSRLQPDVPRAIDRVSARLQDIAEHHVIDLRRRSRPSVPSPRGRQ